MQMTDFQRRVLEFLLTVPKGEVVTYGQIARALGKPKAARAVGNALHRNPDGEKYPCYKVVRADGSLSPAYAFGGVTAQRERLLSEGIAVQGDWVDLSKTPRRLF